MADESQVAMLRSSVERWNRWRAAVDTADPTLIYRSHRDPGVDTCLREAFLSDAQLSGANLKAVDLRGARLMRANLQNAWLKNADLSGADLSGACLVSSRMIDANLHGADVRHADLTDSVLTRATLRRTNLTGCSLRGVTLVQASIAAAEIEETDFTEAYLSETLFLDVDLSRAKGLETCEHVGPSIVDHRTLTKSKRLPISFLRGCGLPERLIDYLPSLVDSPFNFYSCFISYSTEDQLIADRIYADLQNKGVRCWFAPHDISGGKKIHEQIDEAIRLYDRLLLILSEASMNSEWVKTEIANARQKELREARRVLFPISILPFDRVRAWSCFDADTGKDSAREIREYFIPDFSNWKNHQSYSAAFDKLLKGLQTDIEGP